MTQLRVPPGRAGRRWLQHRIEVAERSALVLERREQLLAHELRGLEAQAESARRELDEAVAAAELWGGRATASGGAAQLSHAAAHSGGASITLVWRPLLGVHRCTGQSCDLPDAALVAAGGTTAALDLAARHYRAVVIAAAADAAARQARDAVAAEMRLTMRRHRGLVHRWLPRLSAS